MLCRFGSLQSNEPLQKEEKRNANGAIYELGIMEDTPRKGLSKLLLTSLKIIFQHWVTKCLFRVFLT